VEGSSSLAGRRSHCDASKGASSIARQKYQSEPPASFPALGDEGDCRRPHQAPFGFPGVAERSSKRIMEKQVVHSLRCLDVLSHRQVFMGSSKQRQLPCRLHRHNWARRGPRCSLQSPRTPTRPPTDHGKSLHAFLLVELQR